LNIFFIYEEANEDIIGWTILSIISAAYVICILSYLFSLTKFIVRKAITWYKKRKLNTNRMIDESSNGGKKLDQNCQGIEGNPDCPTELTIRKLEDILVAVDNTEGQEEVINVGNSKDSQEQIDTDSILFAMSIQNTDKIPEELQSQDSSSHLIDRPDWKFDIKNGAFILNEKEYPDIDKLTGMPEDISAVYDLGIIYLVESQIYTENSIPKVKEVHEDKKTISKQTDSSSKIRDFDPMVYSDSKISTKPNRYIKSENPIQKLKDKTN